MPGQPQQQGGTQAGAPQLREDLNIKDLPPSGQVQMASQAGIQTTPQDWTGQAEAEAALKTKSQATLKGIATPTPPANPPTGGVPPSPMLSDPDIAQAHAQIAAHSAQALQGAQQ